MKVVQFESHGYGLRNWRNNTVVLGLDRGGSNLQCELVDDDNTVNVLIRK